jgi:formylglycine-generating enzyme required for sulfatase activity
MLSTMTSLRVIDSGRRSFPVGRHPSKSVLFFVFTLACLMAAGAQAQELVKKDAAPVRTNGFLDDFAAAQKKASVKMTNAAETARSGPPTARPPAEAARERVLNLGNTVTLKLALIPKGTFLMGSPATEKDPEHGHADNEVQHAVTISKSFYMGVTEVTQKQYETVMGKNPSTFKGPNNPVDPVTWDEAVEFCRKLAATTGKTIRLPTEAEWEYACRAGSKTRFSFGDADANLGAYAWYTANSADRTTGVKSTHPAGLKKPNAWGLYDMHGNVWEWCSDWYAADYGPESQTDPAGPAKGAIRVLRGGSWNYCSWGCRLAGRGRIGPDGKYDVNGGGFRVVVAEKD